MRTIDPRVVPSERDRVLARLDKILARTKSSNVHEAATARRMADELMARHGLADADLKKHAEAGYYELSLGHAGFNASWKFALVTAAARYSGCEAMALQRGRRRVVRLVGERAAVERAALFFEELLSLLGELERTEGARIAADDRVVMDGSSRQCADSFRRGAVTSIVVKLIAIRPGRFGRRGTRSRGSDDSEDSGEVSGGRSSTRSDPPEIKSLVIGDKKKEHAERIRQKYAPRMRSIDLDDAPSLRWYLLGYDAADRLIAIRDDDANGEKDG